MPAYETSKKKFKVNMHETPCIQSVRVVAKKRNRVTYLDKNGARRTREQVADNDRFICGSFEEAKEKAGNRVRQKILNAELRVTYWKEQQAKLNQLQESDLKCD